MVGAEDPGAHGISPLCRRSSRGRSGAGFPRLTVLSWSPTLPEASTPSYKTAQVVPFGSEISIQNLLEVCNLKVKFSYLKEKKEQIEHERIQDFA